MHGGVEYTPRPDSPRLLFVVNDAGFFLSHRLQLALAARAAGYDVHVATPDGEEVGRIASEGFSWHSFKLTRSGMGPLTEAASITALVRLYRRVRPTLVHHVTPKPVLYGTLAARLARVPAVLNAVSGLGHAFSGEASKVLRIAATLGYRILLRHPRMRVVFQNVEHLQAFVDRGWISRSEAVLIPGSGIDLESFAPTSRPVTPPVVVVLAARLLATKGVHEFVSAARMLHKMRSARFVLVGTIDPGNPATITASEIAQWVNDGIVEHWGFRNDMPAVYASAHIACLPSYTEGLPKSLLEAAASGLAIAASDEPGCRAVVEHGKTGLLVPVRDARALADTLSLLIEDEALRTQLGANARNKAVAEFGLERIVREHLRVYSELAPNQ